MADCANIPECDFYQDRLDRMPETSEFMKMMFCHKKFEACARYLYHYHKETSEAPGDLMPHEMEKVKEYLRNF